METRPQNRNVQEPFVIIIIILVVVVLIVVYVYRKLQNKKEIQN